MKNILTFILLLIGLITFGQNAKVKRSVIPRDISDSIKQHFYAEIDSLKMYSQGKIPEDMERIRYLMDSSLLPFTRNGLIYGMKRNFGRVGGIGCGYHEGDEPHKVTITKANKERRNYSLYDFEDSTVWYSSLDFKQETINFYFKKDFPPLTTLIFFAGDQSSTTNWKRYSRPKTIAVYIDSKHWTDLHFDDCMCKQIFNFRPISSERKNIRLNLVVKESYSGEDKRVAISEINFDGLIH